MGGSCKQDEALQKLRDMKISKEDILLDKILKSRSEGILVQDTFNTKNFAKTNENMPKIFSDLKRLFPGKDEITILEILKTAATTVLEINNDTIDRTVEFLTNIFDEEVVKSEAIQDFVTRNKEFFSGLKLFDNNGKFVLSATDTAMQQRLSRQLVKLFIKDKPSQIFSYVDSRANLTLKTDVINAYGRDALSKYAVLILEEDASIMNLNLEDCKSRENKIMDCLDKLQAEGIASLQEKENFEKIKKALSDVTILRAENNRNLCLNKNQRVFCHYGKNNTQEKAYHENLKTLLENYGSETVANILSTNLAILDLKPMFLKAVLNKASDFQSKAKLARSLNSVLLGLAGKSTRAVASLNGATQKRAIRRQNTKNIIHLIGSQLYDIDMTELSDDEKAMLDKIFDNIVSSADISDDKLVYGGKAKYGFKNPKDYVQYIKENVLLGEFDKDALETAASQLPADEQPDFYLFSFFLDMYYLSKQNKTSDDLELTRKLISFDEEHSLFDKLHEFHECIGVSYQKFYEKSSM